MVMEIIRDVFSRGSHQMIGRISGPLNFRLIITPIIVTLMALTAGWRDAQHGEPAFFWALVSDPEKRRARMQAVWASIKRVIIVASIIDMLYQLYAFRAYYVFQTILLVIVVAILPYILVRGATTRIASLFCKAKPGFSS